MNSSSHLVLAVAATLLLPPAAANAAEVALVAPRSGAFDLLGKQMGDGAMAAATALGAKITWIDESCEAGSGAAIAEAVKAAGASAAIGFLCSESLDGALPLLKTAGIPAISLSVRAPVLMEDALKHDWPFYRLAPSTAAEAEQLIAVILRDWPGKAFALIEDGTIRGRELAEAIRNALEERGMKPAFIDTFRPGQEQQISLVRRLKKAGATHAFVGGDRNDVAIIARDAAAESTPLTLLGGDGMRAANQPVPLADGVLAVTIPDFDTQSQARNVADRLRQAGIEPEGYVLPAYAAVQIIAAAEKSSPTSLQQALNGQMFETVVGAVSFGENHELKSNPYRLLEWRGNAFQTPSPRTQ